MTDSGWQEGDAGRWHSGNYRPATPIKVSVELELNELMLGAALIDATTDGDPLSEDYGPADIEAKALELGLDGLVDYAKDFAMGTDFDELHAQMYDLGWNAEDVAIESARQLMLAREEGRDEGS